MSIFAILKSKTFIILCFLLVIIDLFYPVTFTYDSGQYMSYLDILDGKTTWEFWDPVRGIVFPLFLKTTFDLFGFHQNALLIPLIFCHLLLFFFAVFFVLEVTKIKNRYAEIALLLFLFIFFAIDPLIMGYFHATLTEFLSATIAVISCFVGYMLQKLAITPFRVTKKFLFCCLYFVTFVPVAWHLKQPYVGTVLFPLFISSMLIILKNFERRKTLILLTTNFLSLLCLGISILLWNQFLPDIGVAANPNRKIDKYLSNMFQTNNSLLLKSPVKFTINYLKNYLALSNVFSYDSQKYSISKKFSMIRANENWYIGYRMYSMYGKENAFLMPDSYRNRIEGLISSYYPPIYFNEFQLYRLPMVNFIFSFSYVSLPFIVFVLLILRFSRAKDGDHYHIYLLYCGAAFLNILEHAFINMPIDRYVFWGYPLLLICISSVIINGIRMIFSRIGDHRQIISTHHV